MNIEELEKFLNITKQHIVDSKCFIKMYGNNPKDDYISNDFGTLLFNYDLTKEILREYGFRVFQYNVTIFDPTGENTCEDEFVFTIDEINFYKIVSRYNKDSNAVFHNWYAVFPKNQIIYL